MLVVHSMILHLQAFHMLHEMFKLTNRCFFEVKKKHNLYVTEIQLHIIKNVRKLCQYKSVNDSPYFLETHCGAHATTIYV